ncbi:hypothetical protein NLU13_4795 [Sarocladium strictum]|uniref:Uncharacterized protein n=1 Tax=Sarocladium strictum TaxID=5046 RepID=A0AA39GJK1_SARSR|nr:hypothetical protein NLU13_4795 [Sarocladium strictum]
MRCSISLLAMGLFIATGPALASRCKPKHRSSRVRTTTSITDYPDTTTTAQTTTIAVTTTSIASTTRSTSTTTSTTTSAITSTTSSTAGATSTAVSSGTLINSATSTSTFLDTTTTTSDVTTSSTASTSTSASVSSTTIIAPAPTPTFTIVGGGGSVNGAPLKGIDQDGSLLLFNPQAGTSLARTFVLDPNTGRLRDRDTGVSVCAYYALSSSTAAPAYIAFCQNGNTGPNQFYDYLTCQVTSGKLTCTAPKASCTEDDDSGITTCLTDPGNGVNNQFYYRFQPGNGDYLYISTGAPNGYTAVDIIAQET